MISSCFHRSSHLTYQNRFLILYSCKLRQPSTLLPSSNTNDTKSKMRFSATITASILFSLLALEAVGAPAPQYDTTIIVSTTVDLAAGSAIDTSSPSASASAETSVKACKAKSERAQSGRHRRPRPSASASGNVTSSQEVPSDIPSSVVLEPSIIPITSVVETEPSPVESQMPSMVETAPVVTPTAIEAGGDGEVEQSPASSQVAQSSAVAFESSYSYESSSSSSWSSSAQPAASASAGGAPAGFEADILNAHNTFRATWGMSIASVRIVLMIGCRRSSLEPDFGRHGK